MAGTTGSRGEWLVAVQAALMGLVFLGPRTLDGLPTWPFHQVSAVLGVVLMLAGAVLLAAGGLSLGRALTPLPYPKDGARLRETGPYALVRHPMYAGGLVLCLGWAFLVEGWLTLGYVAVLFGFLDLKSRREEAWLREKFSTYPDYQRRVRKLIPFVY